MAPISAASSWAPPEIPPQGLAASHPVYNFNNAGAVNCGNGVNMNDTTFTILAWIFKNNSGFDQCGIITKGNNSWRTAIYGTHYLEYTANGIIPFKMAAWAPPLITGPGGSYSPPVTNILDDGQWHFIAAVYDCPYSSGDKRLYFDGQFVQETNVLGSFSQNTDAVWIGNNIGNNNGDNYWPGMISDVTLFNRALSSAEVASLYSAATNTSPAALAIVGQPVPKWPLPGKPLTLTVSPTGPQPFSYEWHRAGIPIPGATRQSYTIAALSPGDAGSYDVTFGQRRLDQQPAGPPQRHALRHSVRPDRRPGGPLPI